MLEARAALEGQRFAPAERQLSDLLKKYPDRIELLRLRVLAREGLGAFAGAVEDVRSLKRLNPDGRALADRELGRLHARAGEYQKSLAAFQAYAASDYVRARTARQQQAEKLLVSARRAAELAANPVPYTATPLAGGVNTPEHWEYFPVLDATGNYMVFTRRVDGRQEDFYYSERGEDGSWSVAEPLDGINTLANEGAQSLTADGSYLVYTACDQPGSVSGCDLYFSERDTAGIWTVPAPLRGGINTRHYEAQPSLAADGSLLFFASRRPGGRGGLDLYVAARAPDGGWGTPVNLGDAVNTPQDDGYPFWARDGQTLFFTSDGHPGLGGIDLFRTQLTADGWTEPTNLGYPINTAADEAGLHIALDGRQAYFSQRTLDPETGRSDIDILTFEIPTALRPDLATYLAATVVDAVTGRPVAATVRLRPTTETARPFVRRAAADGRFLAVLPAGRDYALTVAEEGYLFYADRFTLGEAVDPDNPFELRIELQPLEETPPLAVNAEADGAIAFRNVLFATGSAELLPVSTDELDRLAATLQQRPDYRVEIVGHTDNVGQPADNQRLSEARAQSVADYLTEQGIAADRVTARGAGETRPVAPNNTAEGRARNRRTTFRLLR